MEGPSDFNVDFDELDAWLTDVDLDAWLDETPLLEELSRDELFLDELAFERVTSTPFIPPAPPDDSPWLQRASESAKHYRAFSDYRDLGVNRSLAQLHAYYTNRDQSGTKAGPGKKTAKGPQKPPTKRLSTLKDWSGKYEWVERCNAYDAWLEEERHLFRQQQHLADMEAYRDRQQKMAAAATNVAIRMYAIAGRTLQAMQEQSIDPDKLPTWVRSASTTAQTAANTEAVALGVAELTHLLDAADTDADD